MQFLHPERDEQLELSLDDCFIVPSYFDGVSRHEVDLRPDDFTGASHPIVSANMNAVTGKRMAETIARYGGLGVLPQDMHPETVDRIVRHIQSASSRFDTALEVTPDATLRDVMGIIRKRSHGMVVVVDERRRPLGILTAHDLRDRDQYTAAHHVMSRRLVTLPHDLDNRTAFERMDAARLKAAPVVDEHERLLGVLEKDAAVRAELLQPNVDEQDRLRVAAAIGISGDTARHAAQLVEMGVHCLVVDTAHGHQRRMLEALAAVRSEVGDRATIVAGNVCTAEGTRALLEAGADVAKINVGPG
ncbi:MAG: IMP dehydrogenase, partial [Deltaproteobacteria bacterium]|nr:IMP dehydrogenase [Deltaproteobacteria bacterium]